LEYAAPLRRDGSAPRHRIAAVRLAGARTRPAREEATAETPVPAFAEAERQEFRGDLGKAIDLYQVAPEIPVLLQIGSARALAVVPFHFRLRSDTKQAVNELILPYHIALR
jgi:hypothetical protein